MLDDAAFADCMAALGPFEDHPFLAVAVSGGADSLALTLLADRWTRPQGGRTVGLTVDHGLRSGSCEEARQTGTWLRARNIEHHILPWLGEKPTTGLQRHARDARYTLLAGWCREHHCLHLLTAHHRQDQAETVAIRRDRGSGGAGLAAMPSIREIPGLRLLRPLLGIDKTKLEATLRADAQPWLDDPSNDDPSFTRNRLRKAGLDVDALASEAERRGVERREADRSAAALLVRHVRVDPAGFATLDAAGFARLSPDLARDLLTRLLLTIGGDAYPPRREALSRLIEDMHADPPAPARTLAHCRILTHGDRWLICREGVSSRQQASCRERASAVRLPLEYGRRQRWDDRFLVVLEVPWRDLTVGHLLDRARHAEKTLLPKEKFRNLPGAAKPTLPSIWRGDDLIAVPHLGLYHPSFPPQSIDLHFCPAVPLAKAPFMPHISCSKADRTVARTQR